MATSTNDKAELELSKRFPKLNGESSFAYWERLEKTGIAVRLPTKDVIQYIRSEQPKVDDSLSALLELCELDVLRSYFVPSLNERYVCGDEEVLKRALKKTAQTLERGESLDESLKSSAN
jgi:hypothetical protein